MINDVSISLKKQYIDWCKLPFSSKTFLFSTSLVCYLERQSIILNDDWLFKPTLNIYQIEILTDLVAMNIVLEEFSKFFLEYVSFCKFAIFPYVMVDTRIIYKGDIINSLYLQKYCKLNYWQESLLIEEAYFRKTIF